MNERERKKKELIQRKVTLYEIGDDKVRRRLLWAFHYWFTLCAQQNGRLDHAKLKAKQELTNFLIKQPYDLNAAGDFTVEPESEFGIDDIFKY